MTNQTPTQEETKEIKVKGPRSQRRFLKQLAALQGILQVSSAEKILQAQTFYKKNGRTPMFVLQGLSRTYENLELDEDFFGDLKLEAKIVEDVIGAVDFWWVTAQKTAAWELPAGVTRYAQERHLEACGRAWSWIEARNWVAHRYNENAELTARTLSKKLKRIDWLSPKKESRTLLRWLIEEVAAIEAKVQALDMNDIEGGLHEARRQVRWISIYAGALEGGIVLDQTAKAPENWERYLTKEIVENPFNRLAEPEEDDVPIQIPAPLFYALSHLIDRLGVIKDRAQWTETVQHLLHDTNSQLEKPLNEHMGNFYIDPKEAARQAAELVEQIIKQDKLLPRFIEALQAQK